MAERVMTSGGALVLSLFPGVDLLGLAFQAEWPDACIVRGPDVIYGSLHDVRRFHAPPGVFSGIFGGPPCQHFSPLSRLVRAQGKEPRFGNLIPEFERVVEEAQPDWWLMEQVPQAPEPHVPGYVARHLILNNRWFPDPRRSDGVGAEQRRRRRISFGTRDGRELVLDLAALESPLTVVAVDGHDRTPSERDAARTVLSQPSGFVSGAEYRRTIATVSGSDTAAHGGRRHVVVMQQAVLSGRRAVPVKLGGSGKIKATAGHAVTSSGVRENQEQVRRRSVEAGAPSVTSSDDGASVRMARYSVDEAAELQGLPASFLKDAPFTQDGRLRAIANGVPLPLGRAVARAVRRAFGLPVQHPGCVVPPRRDGGTARKES